VDYNQLKEEFQSFHYDSYTYQIKNQTLELCFNYRLIGTNQEIPFIHKVSYYAKGNAEVDLNQISSLEAFVFHIGMVETINYWKLACPNDLVIHCGYLNESQVKWWKKLYYHGLGEFIYLNHISQIVTEENFVNIVNEKTSDGQLPDTSIHLHMLSTSGNLIPIGGGKDSVVTLEVLSGDSQDNIPFVMSPPVAAYDCIEVAEYKGYLEAKRIFDKQMIKMNDEGFLNGHVPFSSILAFIATLGAALVNKRYIALSNERSANEPSVIGTTFNHQYSKSFEFEEDFDYYIRTYLTKDITYFSLLRPLYEIQIGELFSHYTKYHQSYRSCNRGKSTNEWCGVCAKCLFVYIILSAYVKRDELIKQFGKDLLEDIQLQPIFDELIGIKETKPFECVGTIWEVRHALNLALDRYGQAKLLTYYQSIDGTKMQDQPTEYEEGDLVPKGHLELLKRELKRFEIL